MLARSFAGHSRTKPPSCVHARRAFPADRHRPAACRPEREGGPRVHREDPGPHRAAGDRVAGGRKAQGASATRPGRKGPRPVDPPRSLRPHAGRHFAVARARSGRHAGRQASDEVHHAVPQGAGDGDRSRLAGPDELFQGRSAAGRCRVSFTSAAPGHGNTMDAVEGGREGQGRRRAEGDPRDQTRREQLAAVLGAGRGRAVEAERRVRDGSNRARARQA